MWDAVRRSAAALADLIERDVRPRQIITDGSVRNAVRAMLAIGGSMNTIKHLQAIAIESGLDVDVWEMFRSLGRETPLLCSVRPNGPRITEEFEDAGGGATIIRELLPLLDRRPAHRDRHDHRRELGAARSPPTATSSAASTTPSAPTRRSAC